MKRFHRKVRVRIPNGPIFREPITNTRFGAKEFDSQWRHLNRTCGDPASRARLSWLREQFVRHRDAAYQTQPRQKWTWLPCSCAPGFPCPSFRNRGSGLQTWNVT